MYISTILNRYSRGISLQAKWDCSDQVHSDQMVLGAVRQETGPQRGGQSLPKLGYSNSRGTIRLKFTQIR
jgi:hypothetical protein